SGHLHQLSARRTSARAAAFDGVRVAAGQGVAHGPPRARLRPGRAAHAARRDARSGVVPARNQSPRHRRRRGCRRLRHRQRARLLPRQPARQQRSPRDVALRLRSGRARARARRRLADLDFPRRLSAPARGLRVRCRPGARPSCSRARGAGRVARGRPGERFAMNLPDLLQQYGYEAVFVGTFVEGESMVMLGGYGAHRHYLRLEWVIAAAFAAALLSDQLYYRLGRWQGERMLSRPRRWHAKLARATRLVERHGAVTVLAMRFMWGLRIALPFTIGMSG